MRKSLTTFFVLKIPRFDDFLQSTKIGENSDVYRKVKRKTIRGRTNEKNKNHDICIIFTGK